MQLKLTMHPTEKLIIPFNYNHWLQSALYSKLRTSGDYEKLHDAGYSSSHIYKAFVFGALNGRHTVSDGCFCFNGAIHLEIRSPVFSFCDELQRAFEHMPFIQLSDKKLEITDIVMENRHFKDGRHAFASDSPVCVYRTESNGLTTYFSPDEPDFSEYLMLNYKNKYSAIMGDNPDNIVITALLPQRKIVTRFKETWITCYKGNYMITGSAKEIEFIYNTGLGAKNSQGFGLLRSTEY